MEDLIKLGMEMEEDEVTTDASGDGWTEEDINDFMEGCSGDSPEMSEYCECILIELMLNYTMEEMVSITEEDMMQMDGFEDCVELVY